MDAHPFSSGVKVLMLQIINVYRELFMGLRLTLCRIVKCKMLISKQSLYYLDSLRLLNLISILSTGFIEHNEVDEIDSSHR